MPWAVKKVPTQSKVMCNGHGVIIVTSKSSFLLEELERRISRGYCNGLEDQAEDKGSSEDG